MKSLNCLLLPGLLTLLTACSLHQTPMPVQAVGPAPHMESAGVYQGYLVVYSAWAVDATVNRHSTYMVSSDDGKINQKIQNQRDRFDAGPTPIALPPGAYKVNARSAHSGRVMIPVIINPGQSTYVYLDGGSHNDVSLTQQTNAVKLPDGQVVGWSVDTAVK